MPEEIQITFFVPCLNEEKNVSGALDNILNAVADVPVSYEIMVVDDASTDRTVAVVKEFHAAHPEANIVVIENAVNQGLGHNYRAGAAVAKGRYYMLVNGDNVERRDVIAALLSKIGEADIIIPFFGSKDTRPLFRIIVSRTFTKLVNFLSGTKVRYYNGAVLHLRENVVQHHPGTRGFGYTAELITKLITLGATYTEIEVHSEERQHGQSGAFKIKNFISVAGSMGRIAKRGFTSGRMVGGCLPNIVLLLMSLLLCVGLFFAADAAAGAWLRTQPWPASVGMIFPPLLDDTVEMADYATREHINSLGLRDHETTIEKCTAIRVVALGDSFTYGWGVNLEDCWVKQLEASLREQGIDVEVLNLGRPAAGPPQYAEIAERLLPFLKPDLVLVGLLTGDDLQQCGNMRSPAEAISAHFPNLIRAVQRLRMKEMLDLPAKPFVRGPEEWRRIYAESAADIVSKLTPEQRGHYDQLPADVRAAHLEGRLNPWLLGHSTGSPNYFVDTLEPSGHLNRMTGLLEGALERIKDAAAGVSAEALVLSIPEGFYVNHEAYRNLPSIGFRTDPRMLTSTLMDDLARQACEGAGVPFVTVTERFREAIDTPGLYLKWDRHFTPAGNAFFAEAVLAEVRSALRLPADG